MLPWCDVCDYERPYCSCGLKPTPLVVHLALLMRYNETAPEALEGNERLRHHQSEVTDAEHRR